jgi:hypothetical protein
MPASPPQSLLTTWVLLYTFFVGFKLVQLEHLVRWSAPFISSMIVQLNSSMIHVSMIFTVPLDLCAQQCFISLGSGRLQLLFACFKSRVRRSRHLELWGLLSSASIINLFELGFGGLVGSLRTACHLVAAKDGLIAAATSQPPGVVVVGFWQLKPLHTLQILSPLVGGNLNNLISRAVCGCVVETFFSSNSA